MQSYLKLQTEFLKWLGYWLQYSSWKYKLLFLWISEENKVVVA